jgi:hypothetical protein
LRPATIVASRSAMIRFAGSLTCMASMNRGCVDPSSMFRSAFWWSIGEPLTNTELMKHCYFLLPSRGEKFKSWHRTNITRVAKLLAIRIGRATSKGRPILWLPRLELIQDQRWAGLSLYRFIALLGAVFDLFITKLFLSSEAPAAIAKLI